MHGAGAQHHVETEAALFRHVVAHDPVTRFRHKRYVFAAPFRVKAEPQHAEPELVANFAHLPQVLVHLVTGLMHGFERRSAQLELAAGLERDRTSSVVGESDRVAVFDDRLPSEAGHLAQHRAQSRPVPHRGPGADPSAGTRNFSCSVPTRHAAGRFAAGFEVLDKLPLVGDRRSRRTRSGRHPRRNSSGNVAAARLSNRYNHQQAKAVNGYGRGASHRRSPETPPPRRAWRFRRATPLGRARRA